MGIPAELITKPDWKERVEAAFRPHNRRDEAKAADVPKAAPDESPEWLAWVKEMCALPGRFFTTEPMPNWLNEKVPQRLAMAIKRNQRRTAYLDTLAFLETANVCPPIFVTLTRYGPKVLDDDGLSASLKHFRDGVASALGIDDGDTARLTFKAVQVKAKFYGLRILIESEKRNDN